LKITANITVKRNNIQIDRELRNKNERPKCIEKRGYRPPPFEKFEPQRWYSVMKSARKFSSSSLITRIHSARVKPSLSSCDMRFYAPPCLSLCTPLDQPSTTFIGFTKSEDK